MESQRSQRNLRMAQQLLLLIWGAGGKLQGAQVCFLQSKSCRGMEQARDWVYSLCAIPGPFCLSTGKSLPSFFHQFPEKPAEKPWAALTTHRHCIYLVSPWTGRELCQWIWTANGSPRNPACHAFFYFTFFKSAQNPELLLKTKTSPPK